MISNVTHVSSLNNRNYLLDKDELAHISPKSDENKIKETSLEEKIEALQKREDIYSKMPIRLLGYTNELGEAIRPISPVLANLSWLPAIGYISADIADKYKQDEYANRDKSKGRASKQLVTQLLASVFLPTFAVKLGQSFVDNGAMFTPKKISITTREKISNVVINSMKSGEHKNYLDESGKVDKSLYKEALSGKFDEILKHRKTHKKLLRPFETAIGFLAKPFIKKPKSEDVKTYAGMIVDRMVDDRQKILDGIKPEQLSNRAFKKIAKLSKNMNLEEKQSIAFDAVRKMEKGRMFNNRILKSIGGLVALALLAKPIDKFVEHIIITKFVSPQIDNISQIYYKQKQARKNMA